MGKDVTISIMSSVFTPSFVSRRRCIQMLSIRQLSLQSMIILTISLLLCSYFESKLVCDVIDNMQEKLVCCALQHIVKGNSCLNPKHDVIKRYWPFVWEIHLSPVNSPYKGQWRGARMFSLICVWTNVWVNNRDAGDFWDHRTHYDVIVMPKYNTYIWMGVTRNCAQITINLSPVNGWLQSEVLRKFS